MRFDDQATVFDPEVLRATGVGLILVVHLPGRPDIDTPFIGVRFAVDVELVAPDQRSHVGIAAYPAYDDGAQHRFRGCRLELEVQFPVLYPYAGHGNGQRGSNLAVPERHDVQVIDDSSVFRERVENALSSRDIPRLGELQRDVVEAVGNRVGQLDIALPVTSVDKRILRALYLVLPADIAAPDEFLGAVARAVAGDELLPADVDGPNQLRHRLRALGTAAQDRENQGRENQGYRQHSHY